MRFMTLLGLAKTAVTKVGLSLPTEFNITKDRVTTTGTLAAAWNEQTANKFLAAPADVDGLPSFRDIVEADLPALSADSVNTIPLDELADPVNDISMATHRIINLTDGEDPTDAATYQQVILAGKSIYNVKAYGAKGDSILVDDAAITSGSATLTSSSAGFVSDDVGRTVLLPTAGAAGGLLTTTVSAYVSATQVTLAATASTTVTAGRLFLYRTDDTQAIKDTIDAAKAAGGGHIHLPVGNYRITNTLYMYTGMRITGAGYLSVILGDPILNSVLDPYTPGTTVPMLEVEHQNTPTEIINRYTEVSHLRFVAPPSSPLVFGWHGRYQTYTSYTHHLWFEGFRHTTVGAADPSNSYRAYISDCYFKDCTIGICMSGTLTQYWSRVTNNHFLDCGTGIKMEYPRHVIVAYNHIENATFAAISIAGSYQNEGGILIHGNVITAISKGIVADSGSLTNGFVRNLQVHDNSIRITDNTGTGAIVFTGTNTLHSDDLSICNNTIIMVGNTTPGISVSFASRVKIQGNQIRGTGAVGQDNTGILVNGDATTLCSDCIISGNDVHVANNGIAIRVSFCTNTLILGNRTRCNGNGGGVAIKVDTGCTGVRLSHNKISDSVFGVQVAGATAPTDTLIHGNDFHSGSSTLSRGIRLDAGTSIVITDNRFSGTYGSAKINDNGSTVPTVRRNVGYVTEASGTATVANGQTSVAVTHGLAVTPVAKDINVVRTNNGGSSTKFWISATSSTTFTITVDVDPGVTTATFAWHAIVL